MVSFLILIINLIPFASCFEWEVAEDLGTRGTITFSERYMFESKGGPNPLPHDEAYIKIDLSFNSKMYKNTSVPLAFAVYKADRGYEAEQLSNICNDLWNEDYESWAEYVYRDVVDMKYLGKSTDTHDFGTYKFGSDIYFKYYTPVDGWYNAQFKICDYSAATSSNEVVGQIVFRNPYGYLPGEMWGLLPFELSRTWLFGITTALFAWLFYSFRASIISVHYGIMLVFIVAFTESLAWFVAYGILNETGTPYCCPFSYEVILALTMQVLRQTVSRTLLLCITLGLGIIRPTLTLSETLLVVLITSMYLVSAIVAEGAEVMILDSNPTNDGLQDIKVYQAPLLVMDVTFLTWIYNSLEETIKSLSKNRQTIKLKLYQSLRWCIIFFVFLMILIHGIVLLIAYELLHFPWQLAWIDDVLWKILNFGVLVFVAFICKPAPVITLRLDREQLPTSEDDVIDNANGYSGPDSPDNDDDDESYDDEGVEMRGGDINLSRDSNDSSLGDGDASAKAGFSKLPSAEDGGEYGLDSD